MGDVQFSGAAVSIITGLLGVLGGVVLVLFRALMKSQADHYTDVIAAKDVAYADMKAERDAYQRMSLQSAAVLETAVNRARFSRGQGPSPRVAPHKPEHNSAPTLEQERAAERATVHERIETAANALGIPLLQSAEELRLPPPDQPLVEPPSLQFTVTALDSG